MERPHMTISNSSRTAGPFLGNGITTRFPFAYKVFARDDVLVALTSASGVETILTLDADYTVTLNVDQNLSPGGFIDMTVAPAVGTMLAATSDVALVQSLDLTNGGGFHPKVINEALDRVVINVQQLAGKIGQGLGIGQAAITDAALQALAILQTIATGTGAALIGFLQLGAGAVLRTVLNKLRERVTVMDYMTEAMLNDIATGNPVLDHTTAWTAFLAYLYTTGKSGWVPPGRYNVSSTLDIPAGVAVTFAPSAVLNYTGAVGSVLRIRKGVKCLGNGSKILIANAAWDEPAVLLDGSDHFKADAETIVEGFFINGAGTTKGCGLQLRALNGGEYISFVKLRNFTFTNLKYGLLVSCGGGVDTGVASWHWINSNLLENFSFFYTQFGMAVVGLPVTPAEVAANQFLNFHFQPIGLPVYFFGASWNTFTGYIWDWNYGTSGASIQFDGGAKWNTVHSNIYTPQISGTASNKCFDLTGDETGQKFFWGEVYNIGRTYYGTLGSSGQSAQTYYPDTAGGSVFWSKNSGGNYEFGGGGNPYAGTQFWSIDTSGRMTFGGGANPTLSKFRINGESGHHTTAVRVGADGWGGVIFENAAGTTAGLITVNTSSTVYGTSSDYRLKEDVQPLAFDGSFIDALRPVTWRWKIDGAPGIGFIAHELQAVSPSSVHGQKDAMRDVFDEEGNKTGQQEPDYQSVEYGSAEMIAHLIADAQETRKRYTALEARMAAVESRQ
jgi:hypothetical protein